MFFGRNQVVSWVVHPIRLYLPVMAMISGRVRLRIALGVNASQLLSRVRMSCFNMLLSKVKGIEPPL